jgi:hypothetical protein
MPSANIVASDWIHFERFGNSHVLQNRNNATPNVQFLSMSVQLPEC